MNKSQRLIFLILTLFLMSVGSILNLQDFNNFHESIDNSETNLNLSSSSPLWIHTAGESIEAVAISANGEYIVSGGRDNKVYLFHKSSSIPLWSYTLPSMVWSIDISADGNYIIAAAYWGGVFLFNKASSTPVWNYTTDPGNAYLSISEDGNFIAAGGGNNLYFFSRSSSTPLWNTSIAGVNCVAISSDGTYIAVGQSGNDFALYNKSNSTPIWVYSGSTSSLSIDISSDGKYIVGGSLDHHVYLFNKSSSTPIWDSDMGTTVQSVAISSDGNTITALSSGNLEAKLSLFDISSSLPLWNFSVGTGNNRDISSSSDGNYIAMTHFDYPIRSLYIFEKSNSTPLWTYQNSGGDIRSIALSSDANYLVAGAINTNETILFNIIPSPFNLSTDADTPDFDGGFNLSWTSSDADDYSVYVHSSFITEINESVTLLVSGIIGLTYSISNITNGDYYYKIVAFNDISNRSSNCIHVDVKIEPQIIFFPNFEYLNTTEPMETDSYLEINCSVINTTVLEEVYLSENSTGIYVNRSMHLGINNEWTHKLDISYLNRGDLLSFLFYVKDSFYVRKFDNNSLNFSLFIGDIYPPSASIDYNLIYNPNYVSESTLFNITAFDVGERPSGIFQISYKISSEVWKIYNDPFTLNNFDEGLTTIFYNATDVAGNSIIENVTTYLVTADSDIDNDSLIYSDELIYNTDPFINDTDGDRLSDGDEVNIYQTNPLSSDTDGDNISDGDEVNKYQTNPLSHDTDGDGFSDYVEIFTFGTDPLSAFSSPSMNLSLILIIISALIVIFLIGLFKIKSIHRRRIEKLVIKQIKDPDKKILDCNKFKSKLRGFGSQLDIKEIIEDLQISGKYILDEQIFIKSVELDEIKNVIREKVNNIYKKNLSIREKSNLTIIKI